MACDALVTLPNSGSQQTPAAAETWYVGRTELSEDHDRGPDRGWRPKRSGVVHRPPRERCHVALGSRHSPMGPWIHESAGAYPDGMGSFRSPDSCALWIGHGGRVRIGPSPYF